MLWLSFDFTEDLERYYGEQLNAIGILLVEETEWNDMTPVYYTSNYLTHFNGLQTILILIGDSDEDTDMSAADEVEYTDDEETGDDDNGGANDENSDQGPEIENGPFLFGNELRPESSEFSKIDEISKVLARVARANEFRPECTRYS